VQGLDRGTQCPHHRRIGIEHLHAARTTRRRLQPERTAAGKEIQTTLAGEVLPKPVEQGFPHPVRCRTQTEDIRERQTPTPPLSTNDAQLIALRSCASAHA
jgi:hypothetical protein